MSRAYRKIIYSGLAILFFAITTSCNTKTEWQTVKYDKFLSNDYFGTQCETNHQGEHQLSKSHVYQDGDTLIILFPAELPDIWETWLKDNTRQLPVVFKEWNANMQF